ncbi:unnamed protein product [Amoebophrya sp. A120]|nr:unnamed protein product [Amoebophrya sp. A120]|eukprot:GSA120T00006367001.1
MGCLTQTRIWYITLLFNIVNFCVFIAAGYYPWYSRPGEPPPNTKEVPWIEESFNDRAHVNGLWRAAALIGVLGGALCSGICIVLLTCGEQLISAATGAWSWLSWGLKAKLTFSGALFQTKAAFLCLAAANMLTVPDKVQDPGQPGKIYHDQFSRGFLFVIGSVFNACVIDLLLVYYPCAPSDGSSWWNSSTSTADPSEWLFSTGAEEEEDDAVKARLSSHGVDRAMQEDADIRKKMEEEQNLSWASVFGLEESEEDKKVERKQTAETGKIDFRPMFSDDDDDSDAGLPPPDAPAIQAKETTKPLPQKKRREDSATPAHAHLPVVINRGREASDSSDDQPVPYEGIKTSEVPLREIKHSDEPAKEASGAKVGADEEGAAKDFQNFFQNLFSPADEDEDSKNPENTTNGNHTATATATHDRDGQEDGGAGPEEEEGFFAGLFG